MPESRVVFPRSVSNPLPVVESSRYLMTDFETIAEESFSDELNLSTESLDSLQLLPDIVIPPLLSDPLPLQCLAASALPDDLREELNSIVEQYSTPALDCIDGAHTMDGFETKMSEAEDSCLRREVIERIVLQKDILPEWGNDTYNEIGLKITGGVKCDYCDVLHAVITTVSQSVADKGFPDVKEGQCVVEWCGQSLEGASFERVKSIIQTTAEWTEVELAIKDCRGVHITQNKQWYGISTDLTVLHANVRRKSSIQVCDDSDLDTPTQSPKLSHKSPHRKTRPTSLEPPFGAYGKPRPCSDSSSSSSEQESSSPLSVSIRVPTLEVTPPSSKIEPQPQVETTITPESADIMKAETAESKPQSSTGHQKPPVIVGNCTGYLNGLIQLILEYDTVEYLKIKLCHAKAHASKDSTDSSDVFINTYLIPDTREQGVRSIKVTNSTSDMDNTPSYSITLNELREVALRVILWDASRSKNIVFKGEILLGLSDSHIVDLTGKPVWFTMCSEDPNLPRLPQAVHYKQKHPFLHRFKHLTHSAHSVSHSLKQQALKTSHSITAGFSELKPSHYLDIDSGTVLKKCRPIKTSEQASSADSSDDELDRKKKLKYGSIMRVLKASISLNTSSEDELSSGPSFSTLDRGVRKKWISPPEKPDRPVSDSFEYIPHLRGSLYAKGGGRQVTVYSFLEELDSYSGSKAMSKSSNCLDSIDSSAQHYQLVDCMQSEDELDSPYEDHDPKSKNTPPTSTSECANYSAEVSLQPTSNAEPEVKIHLPEVRLPTLPTALLLDLQSCKGKPGNVRVRSKSVGDVDDLDTPDADVSAFMLSPMLEAMDSPPSLAVADVHQSGSMAETNALHSSLEFGPREKTPTSGLHDGITQSLAVAGAHQSGRMTETHARHSSFEFGHWETGLDDGITQSLHRNDGGATAKTTKKASISKWRSLDNILGGRSRRDSKSKKQKRSFFTSREASARSRTSVAEDKGVVNIKLQLQLNDFNPANPVLIVKVADVMLSSKDLSSDFTMKCCIIHNCTGVCVLKKKTKVSPRNAVHGAPLGLLQFDTDITNLSLQVSLSTNRVFSRKQIGQVTIDLSSLNLNHDSPDCRWYQFRKRA